ncbi:hypothetical protein Hte_001729 [Hypoxylon texense]
MFQLAEFLSTLPSLRSLYIEFLADNGFYHTAKSHRILENFGLLRNVPNVVVDGVPSEYAKLDKMIGLIPADNLLKMYNALDSYARHFRYDLSEDFILRALKAMEEGNVDKFKETRALTVEAVNKHVANAPRALVRPRCKPRDN